MSRAKEAAQALGRFLAADASWTAQGYKGSPSKPVLRFQLAAELHLERDGIVGPETRAAALALGVELPERTAKP
jgi:hypothetical protein